MRPNVSDPLISRRRPTSTPAVSPPPAPPDPDRDAFRGFSGGLWGDATFLDRPRKVSAWMALVMNQRLESFLFDSNFDKHAFSRLTSLEREHAALNSELPEIKQKGEKKIKTPCATRNETMFPPLLPRFLSYSWALRM